MRDREMVRASMEAEEITGPLQPVMTRDEGIALLGGSARKAALAIGCTEQAVNQWPEVLTSKIRDRVQAVLWRWSVEQRERERMQAEFDRSRQRGNPNLPLRIE